MGSGRDSRVGLARGGGEGRGVRKGPWQQTRPLLPGDPSPLRPSRPAASQSPGSVPAPPRSRGLPLRCGLRDRGRAVPAKQSQG